MQITTLQWWITVQFTYGSEVYIWIKSLHAGLKLTNGSEVYIWIRSLDTGQTFTYGSNVYICRKFTYRSEVYIQVKSIYMGQKLTFFLRSLHTGQRFMYGSEVYVPFESLHKFTQTHTQLHFQNDSLFRLSLKLALFILEKQVFFLLPQKFNYTFPRVTTPCHGSSQSAILSCWYIGLIWGFN